MKTVSLKTRRRIEAQGYVGLSDTTLAEVGPWLRFAPALCMTWVAIATYNASATALFLLIPLAALGAIMASHPFELIYNHGIRHLLGTMRLPDANAPRRFACGMATVWLGAAAWAFASDANTVGYILGYSFAIAAAVPTFTDFCIPSFLYGLMFGKAKTS